MDFIDRIQVRRLRGEHRPAVIQLLHGDLAAIPEQYAIDVLVVSAFPNSYTPNPGTLFASLNQQGLDMQKIAAQGKEEDQRDHLGCWLSRELPNDLAARLRFKRILCFEPSYPPFLENSHLEADDIPASVAYVFRCLNHFIVPGHGSGGSLDFHISSVAMPLLATGNQRVPVDQLLPRLLEAAIFWLEQGLPLERLNIVAFKPEDVPAVDAVFRRTKSAYEKRADKVAGRTAAVAEPSGVRGSRLPQIPSRDVMRESGPRLGADLVAADSPASTSFEVFVSYAHKQEQDVTQFVEALKQHVPPHRIFFDRTAIPTGGQWIRLLSDAVQKCRWFVAVLSPDYTASPVCWDEFQCAKLMEYTTRQSIIKTIRLYKVDALPPIMGIYSYADCIEGDLQKLRASAKTILAP